VRFAIDLASRGLMNVESVINRIRNRLDVFHQRKITGVTWRDKMTNTQELARTNQRRMQDILAERRLREDLVSRPERSARNALD